MKCHLKRNGKKKEIQEQQEEMLKKKPTNDVGRYGG
jgi:hypothetical protein